MSSADKYTVERLLSFRHWAPHLFSFRVSKSPAFRFVPGQFARLGLPGAADDGSDAIWRPYSIVSAAHADYLEFFSVVVPHGEFTRALVERSPGMPLFVEKTPFGFLTTERFLPGQSLWMISTGTGLAPFLCMLEDDALWHNFGHLIVVHSVRTANELAYAEEMARLGAGEAPGRARLHYVPIVTREAAPGALHARIPALIDDGTLERQVGVALEPAAARALLCGNPSMVVEVRAQLSGRGFAPARRGQPGTLAVENYW